MANGEVVRQLQVSEGALACWMRAYGLMGRSQAREFKALRDENVKLKKLLGEAELEKAAFKGLVEGSF